MEEPKIENIEVKKMTEENLRFQERANRYIERIVFGTLLFERHGEIRKPTVFLSKDVLFAITMYALHSHYIDSVKQTVCGCPIEIIGGSERLYMGYDLSLQ